jgi:hypothetical protein
MMIGLLQRRVLRLVIAVAAFAILVVLVPVSGSPTAPTPASAEDWTADSYGPHDFYFPIVGEDGTTFYYSDTYGAGRSGGRSHLGVDILTRGVKGVPVVAAAGGTVRYVNWSSDPSDLNPERCCTLAISHDDGWETRYLHLNNDNLPGDDGKGWGIADGIVPGVRVTAGQLIGWVGDSGNAEWVGPHLHWEVRVPGGRNVNPTPYADWATRIDAPLVDGEDPAPPVPDWNGSFRDDEGSVHEANIDIIAERGVTKGCNPPTNDRYCPQDEITRGQMAAFLRRELDLASTTTDYFSDDGDNIFENDINALAAAGIAFGCTDTEYCPQSPLLREEMAELLVRTYGYDNPEGTDFFADDEGSRFEESINRLRNHGITKGCNPPDNDSFCPAASLTRAQMATFFARALGLGS